MSASWWLFVGRCQPLGPATPAIGRPLQNPEPEQSESSSKHPVEVCGLRPDLRCSELHTTGRTFPTRLDRWGHHEAELFSRNERYPYC